ncbi:hypothetical protein Kalk_20385 [Ketobacter alkanivorans]|uniref:DUF4823 domain-containing protein n=2 Tax=Ketobacter alkanivorans TaxID=1917421 RepID=A0A2K9LR73_9GAMM|nr:hypothetical protein Kalk_20385 [Ketobacter alkanivorans]MCP5013808.1 DUF4823 domain-containing protein [Ketobacter sp.]
MQRGNVILRARIVLMALGIAASVAMNLTLSACSSDSYIANASTNSFDKMSPVGSRQVTRQQQLALAPHYRIQVAYAENGIRSEDIDDLNLLARDALARHLKRYFSHVDVADKPQNLNQALAAAAAGQANILMYPRIENWPNIEPLRLQECTNAEGEVKTSLGECEEKDDAQTDELVVMVGIYDVLSGQQVDAIHARSRRGLASYLYEDSKNELEELNKLMLLRLAPNSGQR